MAKKFHLPQRMCVSCRQRDEQSNLVRLQCIDGELDCFSGQGRSFYLCKVCLQDEKKISKSLMRTCRSNKKDNLMNKLKEIITDDR